MPNEENSPDRTSHYSRDTVGKLVSLMTAAPEAGAIAEICTAPAEVCTVTSTLLFAVHCRHTRQHELSGNFRRGLSKLRLHVPPKELWDR